MSSSDASPRAPLPAASIVVPTYARPDRLRDCVAALHALEYPRDRVEIIVVDDGSPTPVTLGAPPPDGIDLKVLRQENAGPARARNAGARAARGEVIAFTDDDCRPEPGWLAHLVDALLKEPAALAGGHTINALSDNVWAEASQILVDFLYDYFPSARGLQPFFTSNNIAARAETYWKVGGFDETFRLSAGEDRDLGERWTGPLRWVPDARVQHYHALDPKSFVRQHHAYGRGAAHLSRRREERGGAAARPEPLGFYGRMVGFPLKRHGWIRGLPISALLAVSQVATLTGVVAESRAQNRGP
jgi:GT2 family glycosyltransferase